MSLAIGIITASGSRVRFIPRFVRQVQAQTHKNLRFVYIQDGPNKESREVFAARTKGDRRCTHLETPVWSNNWGVTPRVCGLEFLASQPDVLDYVVIWDDDNAFYPKALETIAAAAEKHGLPDVMLMPVRSRLTVMPSPASDVANMPCGEIDTAAFVIRPDAALAGYRTVEANHPGRAEDVMMFETLRGRGLRIVNVGGAPIGRYDGMRRLATFRWRMRIPELGIDQSRWWKPIRALLRR